MLEQKSSLRSPGIGLQSLPGKLYSLRSTASPYGFSENPGVNIFLIMHVFHTYVRMNVHRVSEKGAMAMIDVKQFSQHVHIAECGSVQGRSCIKGRSSLLWLLAIVLMCSPLMGRAQELAATLNGVVTDTTGAVIPHASISIVLDGINGTARVVESDGAGNYTAPNLTAGTYSITVTATGFGTYKGKDIVLNVAEKHTVNVQLKAGAATTTVTVEANPLSIDTESSAQAGTISGIQIRELEIASRNFEQLVTLQPGVVNAGLGDEASASNTGLAVNGARPLANNWTVDGADINDSGSNAQIVNLPSLDAIQEFTLQRGNYDAGYGRSGGGQILVATKNGTSSFHGDAYEFVRNTDLDANDYLNKQTQLANGQANQASVNHHNDFGYTVGGPIYIPNHYNADKKKTFFFWSQEWRKITAPSGEIVLGAATANDLAGIMPDTPVTVNGVTTYVPYTTAGPNQCAGITHDSILHQSTIPSSCFSKNSSVYYNDIFNKYPANSGNNYNWSYSAMANTAEEILRVDHYFSDKVHFFARGMDDSMPYDDPMGNWAGNNFPGMAYTAMNMPGKNVVANLTWAISPRIVNELEFAYAQGEYQGSFKSGQFATSPTVFSALTNNWSYADPYSRNPSVEITGVTGFAPGSAPYKERNLDRTYFDNLTFTLGKHTLRTGFQFQQMVKSENGTNGDPTFTFQNTSANAPAAWSFGDFLLGNVLTYSQASRDTIPDLHYINSEAYVQDDWKLSRKLTVNLGVRWSRYPAPSDGNNTIVNFDPLVYSAAKAPIITPAGNFATGPVIPATYANGLIFPTGGECSAAKAIAPLATCSPFGSTIAPTQSANFAPRVGFAFNPDGHGTTSIRGGFGLFYDRLLNGLWEDAAFDNPPLVQFSTINTASFDSISGGMVAAPGTAPGSLWADGTPVFKTPLYVHFNLGVQRQLLPTTTVEVAYVGNVARHLAGQFDENQPTLAARNADTTDDVNAIRPYLGYANIEVVAPIYTNNYNSLQVSLNHRAHGLTLGGAYTWSKDLTTMSDDRQAGETSDTYNMGLDYGPSASNTPQVLEVSYVYDLPFFKQQHGLEGHVLGGWEVSGISSFVSGASFTVTQTSDPFASNGNRGIGLAQQRYHAIRPNQIAPIKKIKSLGEWFSTSSFAPAVGAFGTEHNGALLGPGLQKWDIAAIKNLNLGERVKFQLRGEFFNAFNHASFSGVDSVITDTSFGQVTSDHEPRIVQIAAKLIF
jgi:hypothetical protein